MLWPNHPPRNFNEFPLSRHEWLIISADVFLVRYISVVDCATILVSEVFECDLAFEACTLHRLKKTEVPREILSHLEEMINDQGQLRKERNARLHHGSERSFSSDDLVLRTGALWEHRFKGMIGEDGRALPVGRLFREGLVELQREFNSVTRRVEKQLDRLYQMLHPEFESRFSPKFRVGPFAKPRAA